MGMEYSSMRLSVIFIAASLVALGGRSYGTPAGAAFTVTISVSPLPPAVTGSATTFTATALGGLGGLTYQWDFGDGLPTTFDPTHVTINHTYTKGAHYTVQVNVQDSVGNSTFGTKALLVHYPISPLKPTNSSTIILDETNDLVWCVNADQDTVTAINASTHAFVREVRVGKNPRTLAQAGDGSIWVVSQQHPSISVIEPTTGALLHVVPLPHGSLPYGICMTPDGSVAYVSFQGSGGVSKYATASRALLVSTSTPPSARGVSVTPDGRVLVTRFISPQSNSLAAWNSPEFLEENRGEVAELSSGLALIRTYKLVIDPGIAGPDPDFGANPPPNASTSRGVPNYLSSLVVTPDGRRAFVPSKKDNVQRGTRTPERDGNAPGAEVTYRAIVSSLDLTNPVKTTDKLSERADLDNSEMPQAACCSPLGDFLFVALQGNNRVQVRDAYDLSVVLNGGGDPTGTTPTSADGLAPQGLVFRSTGNKLFVHNYMGRAITIFDATAVLASNAAPTSLVQLGVVGTIPGGDPADRLFDIANPTRDALTGKRVFYNAGDARMSSLGYISCAGCHLDGGSDMRVWDFTVRGEGFRNTITLQGRGGTRQGNVHWSANFNEIQDFDNDVFGRFHNPPLGASFTGGPFFPLDPFNDNANRDDDLDAISTYVTSLAKVSRSPFRSWDGSLTALGRAGEAVFKARNCQRCHKGREFSDSQVGTSLALDPFNPFPGEVVLHDVGTMKATSGGRLGGGPGSLVGIDTPTLKGLWQTAPYLHDGSAATILDVFTGPNAALHMGGTLTPEEQAGLAQYMLEIDEIDTPPVPPTQVNSLWIENVGTGRPYSLATAQVGSMPFVDRPYTIATLPVPLPGKALLRTAEDDKNDGSASLISFRLTVNADVYVFLDSRAGANKPAWLDGSWTASPAQNLFLSHTTPAANELSMIAWRKTFATPPFPQTVTLGGNANGGATGALRNFFVIIHQAGAVFEEGPISQFEFVHDRDADGDGLVDEYEAVSSLSPWDVKTSGLGAIPDEDLLAPSGATRFVDQGPLPQPGQAPVTGTGGGSSGGCGATGLEPLLVLALAAFRRSRRVR